MRRLCCLCGGAAVQPAPVLTPDLVADLPTHTRESRLSLVKEKPTPIKDEVIESEDIYHYNNQPETKVDDEENASLPPRTPSIHIEDISERSNPSIHSAQTIAESIKSVSLENLYRQKSESPEVLNIEAQLRSGKASPAIPTPNKDSKSLVSHDSVRDSVQIESDPVTPDRHCGRDVRTALSECIIPPRHEDWEMILNGLIEIERLAIDEGAHAPAASWRASTRSATLHVRSLRSRVARAACSTLGALFEHRGKVLDPELEEAALALLDRCADVNRFLRADATAALGRVACGGGCVRAGVALARRGATHRAGPVRAAAAQALSRLVKQQGATRLLDLPSEPRILILRAAGELLGDANADTRMHARHLCLALAEDYRFKPLLKEAMAPSRYRAIEKFVDKLRCR